MVRVLRRRMILGYAKRAEVFWMVILSKGIERVCELIDVPNCGALRPFSGCL